MHDTSKLRKLPFIIAFLRIVLAPLLFYSYLLDFNFTAIAIFIIAALTDILDGHLAKKLKVTSKSSLEAYIDAIADFVFVTTAFFAFGIKSIYPVWIPIVIIGMFLFFVFTSKSRYPVYDPIGKYYGSFLIVTVGFTLFFPIAIIYTIVFWSLVVYTTLLIIYRINYLLRLRKNELLSEEVNDSL